MESLFKDLKDLKENRMKRDESNIATQESNGVLKTFEKDFSKDNTVPHTYKKGITYEIADVNDFKELRSINLVLKDYILVKTIVPQNTIRGPIVQEITTKNGDTLKRIGHIEYDDKGIVLKSKWNPFKIINSPQIIIKSDNYIMNGYDFSIAKMKSNFSIKTNQEYGFGLFTIKFVFNPEIVMHYQFWCGVQTGNNPQVNINPIMPMIKPTNNFLKSVNVYFSKLKSDYIQIAISYDMDSIKNMMLKYKSKKIDMIEISLSNNYKNNFILQNLLMINQSIPSNFNIIKQPFFRNEDD